MAGPVVKGIATGAPIAGTGGVGITYQITKETIATAIDKERSFNTMETPEGAWEEIFKKFKGNGDYKTDDFKTMKTGANNSSPTKTKDDLKNLCKEKFQVIYKTIFHSEEQDLYSDVKTACAFSNGEIFGSTSYGNSDSTIDNENLKSYSESADTKPALTEPLKGYKEALNKSGDSEQKPGKDGHVNWCKETADAQYVGDTYEYKVFKEICKKKTSSG